MHQGEVVIRTPCGADFDAMDPRGTARFCGSCNKLVHDLSSLGEAQARALLSSTPESLCVRYLHDETGRIWFGPAAPKLIVKDQLTRGKRLLAMAALSVAPVLFQACGGADANRRSAPSSGSDAGVDNLEPEQQAVDAGVPEAVPSGADADADAGE